MKKIIYSILAIIFLCLIFINPTLATMGAKNGLLLWFNTVLPTLLPFIILSNIIIMLDATKYLSFILKPIMSRVFGLSTPAIYAFVIGLLSGYPLGAKASADLVIINKITKNEGQYLLSFCNNASPMFIIGFIATASLNLPQIKYVLIGIIYLSSIISALIFKKIFTPKSTNNTNLSKNVTTASYEKTSNLKINFKLIDTSIMNGFETITKIGGYIILFSIISSLLTSIQFNNPLIKCLLLGTIEITTGIDFISNSYLSLTVKIIIIAVLTSFGGLSSIAQTESVINGSGLSIFKYIICKLVNALIALILSILFFAFLGHYIN